jgi:hypothetical protein
MSTPVNFFRDKRNYRTIFREGRYLLNTEGMELQLEVLDKLRQQIVSAFGADAAFENALLAEIDPNDNQRLLIRSGDFFIDGYPVKIQAGTDHTVGLGVAPANMTGDDFVRVENDGSDDGGVAINFGGATPISSGNYSIVVSIEEELITATTDPFLRSANLNEDTADKHRIVININIVTSSSLNQSPIPYTGTAAGNLVNEVQIERNGSSYALISSTPLSGAEAIDGRNLEVVFNNGNGAATAAFPVSNADLSEYIHGKLVDSNGVEFHITNIFVTPGNASTITMQLDLEKTRPVQPNTNQPEPVIADGIPYKLRKRDLYVTSAANLPVGKRFWKVAEVQWDGSTFTSVEDLRRQVLAYDGVLNLIRNSGLSLYSEATFSWDAAENGGTLYWTQPINIQSVFDSFEWTIATGNTFSLFGEELAEGEILYVRLMDAPMGGSLQLRKGIRGVGDLERESIQAHKVFWLAKRASDDRVYFSNGTIINDQQSKTFFDALPEKELTQDILSLGFFAMFEDELFDASVINPVKSTGFYFAESYQLAYSNKTITVSGNTVTVPSPLSFTAVEGDAIVQGDAFARIVSVLTATQFQVDDGSVLTNGSAATLTQVMETFNVRDMGDTAKERISSYFSSDVDEALVFYDDSVLPTIANPVKIGHTITADNTNYTDVNTRQQSFDALESKVSIVDTGTDVRLRFFAVDTNGDGVANLESFRVYLHKRTFVGTLLAAVAQTSGSGPVAGSGAITTPEITNNSGDTLVSGRAVQITPSGLDYADASTVASSQATIGVLVDNVVDGASTDSIIGSGLASGVLTGLGFSAQDEVYLGMNGELVNQATVLAFPVGYVQKQIGFAISANDLWVQIQPLEII